MMKYYDLDEDEKQILLNFEEGKLRLAKKLSSIKVQLRKVARNTLAKNKNINIRLSQKTLIKLKAKAVAEGIPYQTLASSILHRATIAG